MGIDGVRVTVDLMMTVEGIVTSDRQEFAVSLSWCLLWSYLENLSKDW